MKTKLLHIYILLMFYSYAGFSQTISPRVYPAQGGSATAGNLQLGYTIGEPLNQTIAIGGYQFSFGFEQPEMNITVANILGSPFCAGSTIYIPFKATGIYGRNNIFVAQLSDPSGNFTSPITIGSDTGFVSDTIRGIIPGNVTAGTHYRIRVITSGAPALNAVSNSFTIIPLVDTPVFVMGDALIYLGDTLKYTATATNSSTIRYSIISGTASIDSISGIVIGADTNFTVRATASNTCSATYKDLSVTFSKTPATPNPPDPIINCGDSAQTITFYNVTGGRGSNQFEWALDSSFSSSHILSSPDSFSVIVAAQTKVTVWLRSKSTIYGTTSASTTTLAGVVSCNYVTNPVFFQKNMGQWDTTVLYEANTKDALVRFLRNGLSYCNIQVSESTGTDGDDADSVTGVVWTLQFDSLSNGTSISPDSLKSTVFNYYLGNDSAKWHGGVPVYGNLLYNNVYSNINLRYYAAASGLKYDFVLNPGAHISDIRMKMSGISSLDTSAGNLNITTSIGSYNEAQPYSYQITDSGLRVVNVSYRLINDTTFGFFITGNWDTSKAIILDPLSLLTSTFFGAQYTDANSTAVKVVPGTNATSGVYFTGFSKHIGNGNETVFDAFPVSAGTYHTNTVVPAVFVTKMSLDLHALIYSTFIGGTCNFLDQDASQPLLTTPMDIQVDKLGNVCIAGTIEYIDDCNTFPFKNSAGPPYSLSTVTNGSVLNQSFFLALNSDASIMLVSDIFGDPTSSSVANKLCIENSTAYIIGSCNTGSDPSLFPVSPGTNPKAASVIGTYLMSFDYLHGSPGVYRSTVFSGTNEDEGYSICLKGNNLYLTGKTYSSDFTGVAPVNTLNGLADAYILCINKTDFSSINWLSYFGGTCEDAGVDIGLDNNSNIYLTGGSDLGAGGNYTAFSINCPDQTDLPNSGEIAWLTEYNSAGVLQASSPIYKAWHNAYSTFGNGGGVIYTYGGIYAPKVAPYNAKDLGILVSGMAVDGDGNCYIAGAERYDNFAPGQGCSANCDFSDTHHGPTNHDPSPGFSSIGLRGYDLFFERLNLNTGIGITNHNLVSTFIGGSNDDYFASAPSIIPDGNSNYFIYLAATTHSNDFPITTGSYMATMPNYNGTSIPDDCPVLLKMKVAPRDNGAITINATKVCPSDACTHLTISGLPANTAGYAYNWSSSNGTDCFDGNTASPCFSTTCVPIDGDVTVSVTVTSPDNASCTFTASTTISRDNFAVTISSHADCGVATLEEITSNPIGAVSVPTWSAGVVGNPDGSVYGTVSTSGTYSVTVTDHNGCSVSASTYVTIYPAFTVTATPTNPTCGQSNGQISISTSPTVTGLTYVWSNGSTTNPVINIGAGTYHVTVSDGGCSVTATATLTETSNVTVTLTASNTTCNGGSDGSISSSVSGATAPYTYLWSNGATTSSLSGLASGNYTVTVTSANGCSATANTTVNQFFIVTLASSSGTTFCTNSGNPTITSTVSGGVSPYTYTWSNSSTSSSIIMTEYGTAGLTVTDANGCSVTAAITLNPLFDAYFSCATNQPAPNNRQIQIWFAEDYTTGLPDGTPPFTYQWSLSSGGPVISTANPYTNLPPNTTYWITVTDATGCQISGQAGSGPTTPFAFDATISGITGATINASASLNNPFYTWYQNNNSYISGPASPGFTMTYTWSNGVTGTLPQSPQTQFGEGSGINSADFTDNITSGGVYTVTVSDNYGCIATATYTVSDLPLTDCFSGAVTTPTYNVDANTTTNASAITPTALSTSSTGNTIVVGDNATLTINQNVTLNGTEVVMGSNARIEITWGNTLTLNDCNIHGCNYMWDGIYVDAGASFVMDANAATSTLADAMNGIYVQNGAALLSVFTTDFYRNFYSIQLQNYHPSLTSYDITDNYFGYNGPMLLVPPGHASAISDHPYAGIYCNNSYGINIPNSSYTGYTFGGDVDVANTFENINCGININNSSVNVYSNYFWNIQPYTALGSAPYFGMGVYAKGGAGAPVNVSVITNAATSRLPLATPPVPVNFNHCQYGIFATSVSITANHNCIDNTVYGIVAMNSIGGKVIIDDNLIFNTGNTTLYGIKLMNNNALPQEVVSNQISVNEPSGINKPMTCGIFQQNAATSNGANILLNYVYGGRYCIYLQNINSGNSNLGSASSTLAGNHLFQNGTNTNIYGGQAAIAASGCNNLSVYFNIIDGNNSATYDAAAASSHHKTAIAYSNSRGGYICNNYIGQNNAIGYGVSLTGLCSSVKVVNNTLSQSKYGMVFTKMGSNTVIPVLGSPSSDPNNSFHGFGAADRSLTVIPTPPYIRPKYYNITSPGLLSPLPMSPTNGDIQILSSAGTNNTCQDVRFAALRRHRDLLDTLNDAIATGYADTLVDSEYVATGPWYLKRKLYQSLCDSVVVNCCTGIVSDEVLTILGNYIKTPPDSQTLEVATELYNDYTSLSDSLPADTNALNDTLLAQFFTTAQTSDLNAIQAYTDHLKILADSTVVNDTTAYDSAILTALALNAAIPDSNMQATNFKTIQSAYLATLARVDTFVMDSATLATIYNIANQCPYVAGDAVYYARGLYAQYVDSVYFDDIDLCPSDTGRSERMLAHHNHDTLVTTLVPEFVKVYPNPAKNLINLAYNAQTNGVVYFELMDGLGKTVLIQSLGTNQNMAQYTTDGLSDGLYFWRLKDSTRTIQTGKVVIMK